MDVFSQKWLFPTIRVFGAYYSNIRIIFGPKTLTEYRIEYHYSIPNYSNIRIIRTIRSNTVPEPPLCTNTSDLSSGFVLCQVDLSVLTLLTNQLNIGGNLLTCWEWEMWIFQFSPQANLV